MDKTVNGFHLIRCVRDTSGDLDTMETQFDILEVSTSKERVIGALNREVQAIAEYPAVRTCEVTQKDATEATIVICTNPNHKTPDMTVNFTIMEYPIHLDDMTLFDICGEMDRMHQTEDIKQLLEQACADWEDMVNEEELVSVNYFIEEAVDEYAHRMSENDAWSYCARGALMEKLEDEQYQVPIFKAFKEGL